MGAAGAAIGQVMAGIVNLLVLVGFILYKKIPYVLEVSKHFRWSRMAVKKYLEKCFPIICNEVLIGVGNMLINVVLGRQTEQAIAAVAVFRTMEGLIMRSSADFPMQPRYWSERSRRWQSRDSLLAGQKARIPLQWNYRCGLSDIDSGT